MNWKFCPRCCMILPRSGFAVNRRRHDGVQSYCKACHNAYQRARHASDPERLNARRRMRYALDIDPRRDWSYRRLYGISRREFADMLDRQGGRCAVCRTPEAECFRGRLYVDHDHDTGEVRGLLCHNCNTALGHAKDDVQRLRSMIAYLDLHKPTGAC